MEIENIRNMNLTELQEFCFKSSAKAGWWNLKDGQTLDDMIPIKLLLMHSEISEATEGHRKGSMDDKLPHRSALEVELADVIIRVLDTAGAADLDIMGALIEKMIFNQTRADHKLENRAKEGGKKY